MMTDTILKTTKKKIDKTDILDQIRRQIITMELMPGEPLDEVEISRNWEFHELLCGKY